MPSKGMDFTVNKQTSTDVCNQPLIIDDKNNVMITAAVTTQQYTPRRILWVSIFTSIFCLWPVGLVALTFSLLAVHTERKHPKSSTALNLMAYLFNLLAFMGGIGLLVYLLVEFLPRPIVQEN